MQARMKNPVMVIPEALQALLAVGEIVNKTDVPRRTLWLMHLVAGVSYYKTAAPIPGVLSEDNPAPLLPVHGALGAHVLEECVGVAQYRMIRKIVAL